MEGEVSQELYWVDTLDARSTGRIRRAGTGLGSRPYPALLHAGKPRRGRAGSGHGRRPCGSPAKGNRMVRKDARRGGVCQPIDLADRLRGRGGDRRHWQGACRRGGEHSMTRTSTLSLGSAWSAAASRRSISKIAVIFEQGPDGRERGLDALSDGQQSLFYFALAAAVFDMERQVVTGKVGGFHKDQLRIPPFDLRARRAGEPSLPVLSVARHSPGSLADCGRPRASGRHQPFPGCT